MTRTGLALRVGSLAMMAALAAACSAAATPTPTPVTSMAPESMAPESMMPGESMAADTMAPESMAPESMMPTESMAPESMTPGASASVTNDGTGTFHPVDGSASGTATLYHDHAQGKFYVTFENFKIDSAAGVHVLLVTGADVTSSSQVDPSHALDLGALSSASGMIDLPLPAGIDPSNAMGFHTVVLWDTGMAHAIAAAPLG
jgi:hypothetical protein